MVLCYSRFQTHVCRFFLCCWPQWKIVYIPSTARKENQKRSRAILMAGNNYPLDETDWSKAALQSSISFFYPKVNYVCRTWTQTTFNGNEQCTSNPPFILSSTLNLLPHSFVVRNFAAIIAWVARSQTDYPMFQIAFTCLYWSNHLRAFKRRRHSTVIGEPNTRRI